MFPLSLCSSFEIFWLFLELYSSKQISRSIYQLLRKTLEIWIRVTLSDFETIGTFVIHFISIITVYSICLCLHLHSKYCFSVLFPVNLTRDMCLFLGCFIFVILFGLDLFIKHLIVIFIFSLGSFFCSFPNPEFFSLALQCLLTPTIGEDVEQWRFSKIEEIFKLHLSNSLSWFGELLHIFHKYSSAVCTNKTLGKKNVHQGKMNEKWHMKQW